MLDKQKDMLVPFLDELAKRTTKGNSSFKALSSERSKKPDAIYYDDKNGTRVGTDFHYPIINDFVIKPDGSHEILPDNRFEGIKVVLATSRWNDEILMKILVFNSLDDTVICIENGRWYTCE